MFGEKMNDVRTTFDETVTTFRAFLRSQGWSDRLLWITRDRITGHRCRYYVFRPKDLTSDAPSRRFYDAILQGAGSVRVDGLTQMDGLTLAYVHDWGGEAQQLNFGVRQGPMKVTVVDSKIRWLLVRLINRLMGESPFLRETKMTPSAEQNGGHVR